MTHNSLSIPAQLQPRPEVSDRRYTPRRSLKLGTIVDGSEEAVIIRDLSVMGMLIETSGNLGCGEKLLVDIPERGPTAATVLWRNENLFGCEFEQPIASASVSAALLKNPISVANFDSVPMADLRQAARPDVLQLRTRVLFAIGLAISLWLVIIFAAVWLF